MPKSKSSNVCGLNSSPVTDGWFRGQVSNDVRWQATDGFGHLNQKDRDVLRRLQLVDYGLQIAHATKAESILALAALVA